MHNKAVYAHLVVVPFFTTFFKPQNVSLARSLFGVFMFFINVSEKRTFMSQIENHLTQNQSQTIKC